MPRAIVALGVLIAASAAAPPPLDLAALLDRYAAGHFDEAVAAVTAAGDAQATLLRQQWRTAGEQWIHPSTRPALEGERGSLRAGSSSGETSHRALAAAAFLLETEYQRAERGEWAKPMRGVCPPVPQPRGKPPRDDERPAGDCLATWALERLVARGGPDEAERAWLLAASSMAGGIRAWRFLHRPGTTRAPEPRGIVAEGLRRFPGDPELRLERALAQVSRYNITMDGGGLSLMSSFGLPVSQETLVAQLSGELTELGADAKVGAEARLRLGYLLWATGRRDRARPHFEAAASMAKDDDVRYLAEFLLGWTAMSDGEGASRSPDTAARDASRGLHDPADAFERALATRSNSQSAALALAALALQRGDASRAYELANATLEARPSDADPWRLFLYGHYAQWPSHLAALRARVRR